MSNDLFRALGTSASGLQAQSTRLRVIAENMANADTTGAAPGEAPYRRKTVTFQSVLDEESGAERVAVEQIAEDPSPFREVYEPGNPAADARGYVLKPNVNALVEMVDMREASRSYEANLKTLETSRDMLQHALDLLR
ncbi:flagellar basal body rod protein FlgC [Benzoatithermus flavus]|uniref:Flagellar basal-body rod protein FlgC n=1 Tax=Benzoatithermus flavus TaxID=3108223 RepID=A0ABU8XUV8_9PROT